MSAGRHFATREEFASFSAQVLERHMYRYGDWWFSPVTLQYSGGSLSPREAELLLILVQACPMPVPVPEIIRRAGNNLTPDLAKTYVYRLRRQLGTERIRTVPSAGYVFVPFPDEEDG